MSRRSSPTPLPVVNPDKPALPLPTLQSEPPNNRFVADFVPAIPASAGNLVSFALAELTKPRTKLITPQRTSFASVSVSESTKYRHPIDDDYQKTAITSGPNSNSSPSRPALADVFSRPNPDTSNQRDRKSASSPSLAAESKGSSELHILDPAELHRSYLYTAHEVAESCKEGRRVHSQSSSTLLRYDPDWQCPEPLEFSDCSRKTVNIWNSSQQQYTQILCLIDRLTMCIGDLEPFFCSLAVYDLRPNAGRISENFYFDLNSEEVLTSGLSVWRLAADEVTLCRNAIFTIPDRHPLVVLVLRIERILQGDPEEAFEPYLKEKGRPVNEMEKISKRVRATINRLSDYRQSFGVAVIPLFSETGELINDMPTFTTNKIFVERQACDDASFLDQLREYFSLLNEHPLNLKKKVIPNTEFALECHLLDNQILPQNRVDPSLIPLKSPPVALDKPIKGPVREVQYLPLPSETITTPFDYFVNSLYIYPLHVQFQKYRNIACKVELRLSDASVDSDGVKTFFGKSSQGAFVSSQITQVAYHNKSPWMQDEMKLMLPLTMTDSIHLFFTFFHISCQKKVGKPTEEVIGYSIFPLFKSNMLVRDGIYNLVIASHLPDHYISKFEARAEDANISFRMQTAECFQIRIRSLSCIFCTDPYLNTFIATLPSPKSSLDIDEQGPFDYDQCLDTLRAASAASVVQYLPAVMTLLFSTMSQAESFRLQYTCFCALDIIVSHVHHHVDDGSFRSDLITAYIQHRLTDDVTSLRCTVLLQRALHHLDSESNDPKRQLVIRNLWFWLDCLIRISSLELLRGAFHVQEIYPLLVDILELLASRMPFHRSPLGVSALRIANSCIALFLTDLFSIIDKQLVFVLASHYFESIDAMHDSVLLEFKIRFVEIIFDCSEIAKIAGFKVDHLSDPLPLNEVMSRYPLQALLIRFVETYCDFQERSIRGNLIKSLRKICTKLDRDSSLSPIDRKCLSTSFLPFLQAMGDRFAVAKDMPVKQRRDLNSVLVWIVGSADERQLSHWIGTEDSEILQGVNQLLCLALLDFNYIGMAQRSSQTEFDAIISPESCSSLCGIETGEVVVDLKTNIEQMMGTLVRGVAGPGLSVPSGRSPATWSSPHRSSHAASNTPNGSVKLSLRQKRAQMAAHGSIRRTADKSGAKFLETVNTNEGFDLTQRICNLESALAESVGASCLRWVVVYIEIRWPVDADEISTTSNSVVLGPCDHLVQVISTLLLTHQPVHVHIAVYPLLQYLLYAYGHVMLLCSSFNELAKRVLIHCTSSSFDIRASSASMLYWIAAADLAANRSLKITLSIITESLSNMVEIMSNESAQRLSQVFRSVPLSALPGLDEVINQVLKILADAREVARQEFLLDHNAADCALFEDLLLNMAQAYKHLPSIRIHWLQRLADHCNKYSKFAEAAQTMVTISDIIISLFANVTSAELLPDSVLCKNRNSAIQSIYEWENPGIVKQLSQPRINLRKLKSDQHDINLYDRIVKLLLEACHAFHCAQLYERCQFVYRGILLPIMERHQDFSALSTAYLHLHSVFSQLISSIASDSRLLGSYYRITFVGDPSVFGTDSYGEKQYIYKMPKITRLPEVVEYMKASYGQQLKPGQVIRIWPDSGPIDKSRIGDNEQVIQVTFVLPYANDTRNFIDRNCDLKRFVFSTPFIVGDPAVAHSSDITKQQKRNIILEVTDPFPAMVSRQVVIATQEVIMSPVESATENVAMRTVKLREAVQDKSNVDKKVLSSLLQGSVMLQVHGGTKEIALAFFGPESAFTASAAQTDDKKLLEDLEILKQAILEFMDTCEMCIEVYGSLIQPDDKQSQSSDSERILHAEFDKHLRTLRGDILPLIKVPKNKTKRAVRFEGSPTKSIVA